MQMIRNKEMNTMSVFGSNSKYFVICLSCFLLLHTHEIQAQDPLLQGCSSTANYTSGSQFQTNLNTLLQSLFSNAARDGFYNTTVGASPDTVYGLAQCRGDVSAQDCQNCLNTSTVEIVRRCPSGRSATLRYDNCLLRYSSSNFFSQVDGNSGTLKNTRLVPDADANSFNTQLGSMLNNLSSTAASRQSKFDTGSTSYTAFNNLYGLTQCTEDLSGDDCLSCLRLMISKIPSCCNASLGAQIFSRSCYLVYQIYPFVQTSATPPPPIPQSKAGGGGSSTSAAVIIVPVIVGVLLSAVCAYLVYRRMKRKPDNSYDEDEIGGEESLNFDLNTIKAATNDFSDSNKLGQGGFGAVYRGKLVDGREIAVKRLSQNSGQGSQEFKNEVVLLHKLQHRNLVRLLGFSLRGEEKLLIYEYVPNRSLDQCIFDVAKKSLLDWESRYKIIGGIAKGLLYLHEDSRLRIIHRDLKAGNILLDGEMNAKIADFGMAKLFGVDQTQGNTSRIAGTFGYMAPEYALHGLFSVKSDVFSFGVLILEIVSGQKINSFHLTGPARDLLSYAWKLWREGKSLDLMDPTLQESFSANEVVRCIHIGLLCVQDNLEDRPTMSSVVLMLNSYSITLDSPTAPAFSSRSITGRSDGRRDESSEWTSSVLLQSMDSAPFIKTNPR